MSSKASAIARIRDNIAAALGFTPIDPAKSFSITTPIPFGYGSGSGGSVTQPTSKATQITLNSPTGRIVLAASPMAPGETVMVSVINSTVTAVDVAHVSFRYDGIINYANYNVWAAVLADGLAIYVKNISTVTLSEALKLNFVLLKGSTS